MISSSTPESNRFPARRSSTDLTDHSPSAMINEVSAVANDSETFRTPTCDDQQARHGWYYGLDDTLNRQLPATTNDVAYYVRQTEQLNLSTSVESKHDAAEKWEAGYRNVAAMGGEVVWSGQSWTTPRQLRTLTSPVEIERNRMSNGETTNHEINSVLNSDVASNYIIRRESFVPVTRLQSQNWTVERHWNVGRRLPEIMVTPATDERRRRGLPTSQKQLSPTTLTQSQPRPRDYNAIYAWSPDLPTTTAMKRSVTVGDSWNLIQSNADGYIDPTRYRAVPMAYPADRQLCTPSSTTDRHQEAPRFFNRTNSVYCGDFVDMRGVCRTVVCAADLLQIELFYRSNKTEVISCACAARLYFASVRRHSSILASGAAVNQPQVTDAVRWYPTTAVGVPVIVLDCGGSRCRERKLSLVLAT